jgi:uncharacterized membrane protein
VEAYVFDWLNLLGRWLHFVAGVAWIGASFYFVWLDNHLLPPANSRDEEAGVGGEVWSVHGGGFYHARKFKVAPPRMPSTLHWFKWEAYTTWLSGMFLMVLIYWYGAEIYLVDPGVAPLSQLDAIVLGAGTIVVGWIVYDLLCRSPLGNSDGLLAVVLFGLISVLAWWLCQTFSGRGAYMHFGALLGTIMAANVFFVIIPGQKAMVEACKAGREPDPAPGIRAKQRSVHNTYFTLPVLFVMMSNHFSMTWAHEFNWLILIGISLAGALIRAWFVARHKGRATPLPAVIGVLLLILIAFAIAPPPRSAPATVGTVSVDDVRKIMLLRCTNCHAKKPHYAAINSAPAGIVLETNAQIRREAARIYQQVVVSRGMPVGNLTDMTDEERQLIAQWYSSLATGN